MAAGFTSVTNAGGFKSSMSEAPCEAIRACQLAKFNAVATTRAEKEAAKENGAATAPSCGWIVVLISIITTFLVH
jgi:hypothetical protein